MKAVIFAAGHGVRLRPLTNTIPKPLLKVLGEPVLIRLISSLTDFGIESFVVITHYHEDTIISEISQKFPSLDITFIHQPETKGTANALLLAKDQITEDFFIAVNGDCIFSPSLIQQTVDAARRGVITLGGKLVKDTENFGIIIVDDNNNPQKIVEKPEKGLIPEGYANIGIYSLSSTIIDILEDMETKENFSPRGEYEIPDAINRLLEKGQFESVLIKLSNNDYWFDIGRPWSLLEANETVLATISEVREGTVQDGAHLNGKVIIMKNAIIRSGSYIEGPVFIDENADIGPNCYIRSGTYIGKRSRIGNACEVKNSIIEENTHIAHLSYIGDSIIGPDVNFGAGTITANLRLDDKTIPVSVKAIKEDSGRRKLGLICGARVKTGIGVLFMPGVKVGNDTWIGAGTNVHEDIPAESIYYSRDNCILKRKRKDVG